MKLLRLDVMKVYGVIAIIRRCSWSPSTIMWVYCSLTVALVASNYYIHFVSRSGTSCIKLQSIVGQLQWTDIMETFILGLQTVA